MRAARAVQEAFGVRSTVAALGLSPRTVAQLIEGRIDDIVEQQKVNAGSAAAVSGVTVVAAVAASAPTPQPFARPAKPAAAVAEQDAVSDEPAPEAAGDTAAESADTSVHRGLIASRCRVLPQQNPANISPTLHAAPGPLRFSRPELCISATGSGPFATG